MTGYTLRLICVVARTYDRSSCIDSVTDVHETRDGIEKLPTAEGYRVAPARDEPDTIESAQHTQPDLIPVSLTGLTGEVLVRFQRIAVGY